MRTKNHLRKNLRGWLLIRTEKPKNIQKWKPGKERKILPALFSGQNVNVTLLPPHPNCAHGHFRAWEWKILPET